MRRTALRLCEEAVVTPWGVTGSKSSPLKYDSIMQQFGSQPLTPEVLGSFAAAMRLHRSRTAGPGGQGAPPPPLHRFLRRGIAFTHRGLENVSETVGKDRRFYLYTGRGPSDKTMHLGHAVPFLLTKYLQDAFGAPLVVQMTDDEKYLFRDLDLEKLAVMTRENVKDILAFGFDPEKTFVFSNLAYMHRLYRNTLRIQRNLTYNKVAATFGFDQSDNIGKVAFPAIQIAPCLSSSFPVVLPVKASLPCLVPCAIDQDPFFLLSRDVCPKLKAPKPSLLMTKFLAPLTGVGGKMSSSADPATTILLTDDRKAVSKKLKRAYSGGAATLEEFREKGGCPEVDVPFAYLKHFLEDDGELAAIEEGFRKGTVHSGIMKQRAAEVVSDFLDEFQHRRALVTDDDVDYVMRERSIL
ncbi:Tryptophan--tRNA ligase [Diplonema papillatum]|nr:Tryptophan--tRNA ligase [Diplonema papillatum]|eukprot:gene8485-13095_t